MLDGVLGSQVKLWTPPSEHLWISLGGILLQYVAIPTGIVTLQKGNGTFYSYDSADFSSLCQS